MKLKDFASDLSLEVFVMDDASAEMEVSSLYCGDLLSDVMANVEPGAAWMTIQGHINTVAVAQLKDVACVVLVNGVVPEKQALEKSRAQGVSLLGSPKSSAALCMAYAGKF